MTHDDIKAAVMEAMREHGGQSMSLILLHDPNNAASVAFLPLFGASGEVITGHDACVAAYPNIQGYPTVAYKGQTLFNPVDMAAVSAWQAGIDHPPVQALGPIVSKYTFSTKLLTSVEGMAIFALSKTNPQMEYAKMIFDQAEQVDLHDPNVAMYLGVARQAGVITGERVAQVLAGVGAQVN